MAVRYSVSLLFKITIRLKQKLSIIKLSKLETILNYALQ